MPSTVYYNGEFYKNGRAVLPISDRSIFFGDAVYDAIIGRRGRLFLGDEHFDRLISNAARIGLENIPLKDKLRETSYNVVKKSRLTDFFLYVQLSRCAPERIHAYADGLKSALLLTVSPFSLKPKETRLSLITEEDRRYGFCDVKTVNLLPAVLASRKALLQGRDEVVLHRGDTVTECAHSNVSILKNGQLITHQDCNLILPGISKRHLILAAKSLGIEVEERPFTLEELFSADEVLITSTSKLCLAASDIDGKEVGGKDAQTLRKLQDFIFAEYAIWTM